MLNPSGGPGIYGVVEYKNRGIGVIPVDEEGFTWLVGQWRYCHERYEWEIPEGGCPAGESPVEAARRELLEETGIVAAEIRPLLTGIQLSNSTSNEVCDVFVATGLTFAEPDPEETEQLEVLRLPLVEAIEMARDGRIRDSVCVQGNARFDHLGDVISLAFETNNDHTRGQANKQHSNVSRCIDRDGYLGYGRRRR